MTCGQTTRWVQSPIVYGLHPIAILIFRHLTFFGLPTTCFQSAMTPLFDSNLVLARNILRSILALPGGPDLVQQELRDAADRSAQPCKWEVKSAVSSAAIGRPAPLDPVSRSQAAWRGARAKWRVGQSARGEMAFIRDVSQGSELQYSRCVEPNRLQQLLAAIADAVGAGWRHGTTVIASVRRPTSDSQRWLELATQEGKDLSLRRDCDAAEERAHVALSGSGFGSGEIDAAIASISEIPIASVEGVSVPMAVRSESPEFVKFARRMSGRVARGPQISSDRLRLIAESLGCGGPVDHPAWRTELASRITQAMARRIESHEALTMPLATAQRRFRLYTP